MLVLAHASRPTRDGKEVSYRFLGTRTDALNTPLTPGWCFIQLRDANECLLGGAAVYAQRKEARKTIGRLAERYLPPETTVSFTWPGNEDDPWGDADGDEGKAAAGLTLLALALADDGTIACAVQGHPRTEAGDRQAVLRVTNIGGIWDRGVDRDYLEFAVPREGVATEVAGLLDRLLGSGRKYPTCWAFVGDDPWPGRR